MIQDPLAGVSLEPPSSGFPGKSGRVAAAAAAAAPFLVDLNESSEPVKKIAKVL